MQLREMMTRDVEIVHPDTTLREAAEKMRTLDIGPLPVHDGTGVVGMITDRDITVRAIAEGWDPRVTRVREVMTPGVFHCFDDQDVRDAAKLMAEKRVRRLPILDRSYRLVGLVSLGDLAAHLDGDSVASIVDDISSRRMRDRVYAAPELQQWPPPAWW